jgi:FAD/FMN-containing dehydrogenase
MSGQMRVDVDPLRRAIAGEVITSDEPGWDAARQPWSLTAEQHPALVVLARAVDDVAATVRFASANGLRVAPQSTGHGAPSMGALSDAILLRTGRLNGVTVDPASRAAKVQAGARWREVIAPAAEHGLACLHGMSGGVGVAGYTLGGGLGWLARREGFASSHVRSFDVVTADGEQRHVDCEQDPELFWALRGGGGRPAMVTALELELFPLRQAFAGALMWPIERASEVVQAYQSWIAAVPDAITSTIKLVRFPPLPQVPDPLRGKQLVAITLAFTGDEAEGKEIVAPLRTVAATYLDTLAMLPAPALGEISGDPQDPVPGVGTGMLLDALTPQAAETYVELAGPEAQTPLVSLEIRHLGGALRSGTPDPGAAGALESEVIVGGQGLAVTPDAGVAVRAALEAASYRLAPWISERRTLLNFAEEGLHVCDCFSPEVTDRLARITATFDPDGLFVANHELS